MHSIGAYCMYVYSIPFQFLCTLLPYPLSPKSFLMHVSNEVEPRIQKHLHDMSPDTVYSLSNIQRALTRGCNQD